MKILLLSPHTDDIELGAGGTVIKLLEEKSNDICWAVFSICEDAVPEGLPPDTLEKEFTSVASKLGIRDYRIYRFPNKNFPQYRQEILSQLDKVKREFKPDLLISPSLNDFHQDHKIIAEEAVRAFKKDAGIIGYELPWNNLVFSPQLTVKLTGKQMEGKWELLSIYKSQFTLQRSYFSKEFIFGWARMRGVQCNSEYAEAFEVVRWIIR
jgi:LmbE family N-acetylglucosaminyl deacetylase